MGGEIKHTNVVAVYLAEKTAEEEGGWENICVWEIRL
jgi:hypothetical protein